MYTNNKRIDILDSLRGLAALSVVFHHCLLVFPIFLAAFYHNPNLNNNLVLILTYSPIHILWAGHEAVILFFVLSGFVLSLPFLNNNTISYHKYIVKRFCRIYIPYIIVLFISS